MKRLPEVTVVGDLVLDRDLLGSVERVCPDAPVPVLDVESERSGPGAAGLSALLCAAHGMRVTLVAPVADDRAGEALRGQLDRAGVHLVALEQEGPTRCKTRARSGGQSLLRVDEGGPAAPVGEVPHEAVTAIEGADVVLVSCYGAGTTDHPPVQELLATRARRSPLVWDPHPKGPAPVPGCTVVTPNLTEARAVGGSARTPEDVAGALVREWAARSVCVTDGPGGAWLATSGGEPTHLPTTAVEGDSCGAGDAFVAGLVAGLARGATTSEAAAQAVAHARRWLVDGGTESFREGPSRPAQRRSGVPDDGRAAIDRVRAEGGTIVATGGCFDLLHAGHVSCLEAARGLGDALVVLINSDTSVARLKGPGRPAQPETDRARVLRGLSCVDHVIVFDEETPHEALRRLRPDVWAKGGDYENAPLPESGLVRGWGVRVVLLPHLTGRSPRTC